MRILCLRWTSEAGWDPPTAFPKGRDTKRPE